MSTIDIVSIVLVLAVVFFTTWYLNREPEQ